MSINQNNIFIDWLSLKHPNNGRYTIMNDGQIINFDKNGEILYHIDKHLNQEGSYSTNIRTRVTKDWLEISFNPSRYNRLDNLYGLTLEQCIKIINQFLHSKKTITLA